MRLWRWLRLWPLDFVFGRVDYPFVAWFRPLMRVGVTFTQEQKDKIAEMVARETQEG